MSVAEPLTLSGAPARPDLATPPGRPRGAAALFCLRTLPYVAARIGVWLARLWGKPFRLGGAVVAVRHSDVSEVLARDLDFIIRPINGPRFDEIGYHFILGMDRSAELTRERRALYTALAEVDMAELRRAAARRIAQRLAALRGRAFDAIEDYARPLAAETASALFGIAPEDKALFMDVSRAIFGHCFLNVANDKTIAGRAVAAAAVLSGWFDAEIAARRTSGNLGRDLMGRLLRNGASDDLARRSLGGMLVGSIDTTATVVAKVLSVLMADPALLERARADRDDRERLYGWCQEALRRWPHAPLLVRQAACDTTLAGAAVPAGANVILWTQAAMLDASAFPDPETLRPDRPSSAYLHLGGGLHPCAGRGVNAWQIPMLVAGLLEPGLRAVGPVGWAGPFPASLPIALAGSGA